MLIKNVGENWQRWARKTQDANKKNTTQKIKRMSNTDPTKQTGSKLGCLHNLNIINPYTFISKKTEASYHNAA
jgi:hypothetical protein